MRRLLVGGAFVGAVALSGCGDLLGFGGDGGPQGLRDVAPAAGTEAVSVLATPTLQFSQKVNASTVAEGIQLRGAGRLVQTEVTLVTEKTVRLIPTDPLDFGTTYEVTVTLDLLSRSGKSLAEPESWEFTTEGLPPPAVHEDSLLLHLENLAADSMRGRGSGTDDELRAARYLEGRYLAYGLQPAPGGMIQPFQATSFTWGVDLESRNVLAVLPGSGSLAEEWVVVGAHYDHVGVQVHGGGNPATFNGADDNASGTVLILEMARVLRLFIDAGGMGDRDRRSVLFAAFGAEEPGLLGSCHYVRNEPAVPLFRTKVMMNFDMVGRLRDNQPLVFGEETSEEWAALMTNANAPGLNLVPWESCQWCSDHGCFWEEGIPFLWPYTKSHPEYHTPEDDVELLNIPGMAMIGDWSLRVLNRVLVMPDAPAYDLGSRQTS